MQFTKLRLSGFKSFVEPTEFVIHPGLTGVVGPNGCGKSNLVEALRWVMGENSAKRMRGSGMDDMIFAGTATRPARNVAEVSLSLDNQTRTAPAAFNEQESLEIVRRIERERGSDYRINGQDVRARDVQLFFADLASGANSPAMVSQGRVGAIINAKPTDRRMLLEEAAGISGLHSRRHEAELRLKAAENNLERVVDVIGQLDQQLQGLKRQARQASRYRNIAGQIRRTEAILFHLRHTALQEALAAAESAMHEAEREVADRTLQVSEAHGAERIAAESLPPLRQAEAEAGARLHRLAVARDGLDAEEARAREAAAQVEQRIAQIDADRQRERTLNAEALESLQKLAAETETLLAAQAGEAEAQSTAETAIQTAQEQVANAQAELDAQTERAAAEQAERARLLQTIEDADRRLQRLRARLEELTAEHRRLETDEGALAAAAEAGAEIEARLAAVEAARVALDAAEAEQAKLVETARAALEAVETDHAGRIEAARAALEAIEAEQAAKVEAVRAGLAGFEQEHNARIQAARESMERLLADEAVKVDAARAGVNAVEAEHAQHIDDVRARANAAEAEKAALIEQARAGIEAAEAERQRIAQAEQAARDAWQAVQGELTRLKAEEAGLARLLKVDEASLFAPVIDQLTVEPGFEKALGAALGDELNSSADTGAPVFWEALPPLSDPPALPDGAVSLTHHVAAPPALARCLGLIGVVDEADGARLRNQLRPGQRLVSKSGALWRWDGFTVKAGAPTPASIKLEQRNRLADLREELRELEARLADAQDAYQQARLATEQAAQAERAARGAVQQAEAARDAARAEGSDWVKQAEQAGSARRQAAAADLARAEQAREQVRREAEQAVQQAERERSEARQRGDAEVANAERERVRAREAGQTAIAAAERERQAAREQANQTLAAAERERQASRQRCDQDIQRAERELEAARARQADVVRREAERQSKLAALADQIAQLGSDAAELETQRQALADALALLPDESIAREAIAALRQQVDGLRQALAEARAHLELLRREAMARAHRLEAIQHERASAETHATSSAQQLEQLESRHAEAEAELLRLYEIPAGIEGKRTALLEEIGKAEAARNEAADHLANAEGAQSLAARTARELEQILGHCREARVRAEADLEHQRESLNELALRIRETLECEPADVLKAGEVEEGEEFPTLPQVETRLERLRKERDNMGPVNLRAELEANEVEEKLNTLQSEQTDLIAAIEKLRQGIASLNKEGRERLLEAFQKVDGHFQKLFVEVFGGGKAHLQLVESDDPLEAGLEIMASPPGKRLQVMSLLSGGEQALTALSLLFAVFLTNPAPICVLDEVDAPLDDANVERLCNLMETMARQTSELGEGTRFVVVTHHPITMARMDRLFGVTMAERGVSTLVSVDLAGAEAMRQTA